uniref:Uncharacterized protein n=1 Tax=Arundo donax TaxID=35708 RepID=A0A0A9GLQ9_ARUDO
MNIAQPKQYLSLSLVHA